MAIIRILCISDTLVKRESSIVIGIVKSVLAVLLLRLLSNGNIRAMLPNSNPAVIIVVIITNMPHARLDWKSAVIKPGDG